MASERRWPKAIMSCKLLSMVARSKGINYDLIRRLEYELLDKEEFVNPILPEGENTYVIVVRGEWKYHFYGSGMVMCVGKRNA